MGAHGSPKQTNLLFGNCFFLAVLGFQWEQWLYHHLFGIYKHTGTAFQSCLTPVVLLSGATGIITNFSSVKEASSHLQGPAHEIVSMAWRGREKPQHTECSCSQHWGNSAPCTAQGGSITLQHSWLVRIAMNHTNSFQLIFIEELYRLLIILVFIFWTPSSSLYKAHPRLIFKWFFYFNNSAIQLFLWGWA